MALYLPDVSSIYLPLPIYVKNKCKFVFLLLLYIFLLAKHKIKKIKKNQEKKRSKKLGFIKFKNNHNIVFVKIENTKGPFGRVS